jgi:protein-tyrosine phosphatase
MWKNKFEITDFHSHILPRTDHGCKCSAQCKEQLAMLCDVGTEIVVATPHFYPHVHNVDEFLNNVEKSLSRLYEVGIEKAPRICVGAEVLICENIEKLDGLDKLCIRGTKILLLELPSEGLSPTHLKTVETIMENGYTVVPEHYDVSKIANQVKHVPAEFINAEGNGVTDDCCRYIQPLTVGESYPEYKNGMPEFLII